jgi:hypothetical protein
MPFIDHAQPLRAIGQALEILQMENFQLELDGDDFIVRGRVAVPGHGTNVEQGGNRNLRFRWDTLKHRHGSETDIEAIPASEPLNPLELCYTLKDVGRLERSGQAQRGGRQGPADVLRSSQILRTIGAYLDEKPARLVKIWKNGASLTVVYETFTNVRFEEKLALADMQDLQRQMSRQRGKRELH